MTIPGTGGVAGGVIWGPVAAGGGAGGVAAKSVAGGVWGPVKGIAGSAVGCGGAATVVGRARTALIVEVMVARVTFFGKKGNSWPGCCRRMQRRMLRKT